MMDHLESIRTSPVLYASRISVGVQQPQSRSHSTVCCQLGHPSWISRTKRPIPCSRFSFSPSGQTSASGITLFKRASSTPFVFADVHKANCSCTWRVLCILLSSESCCSLGYPLPRRVDTFCYQIASPKHVSYEPFERATFGAILCLIMLKIRLAARVQPSYCGLGLRAFLYRSASLEVKEGGQGSSTY